MNHHHREARDVEAIKATEPAFKIDLSAKAKAALDGHPGKGSDRTRRLRHAKSKGNLGNGWS
jgi:hypothetical protein